MVNRVTSPGDVILVTGGSGFVGRHLVRLLVERGQNVAEVRVFDIVEPPEPIFAEANTNLPVRVSYVIGDVCDLPALRLACAGVDACLHVAAMLDTSLNPDVEHLYAVNVTGTENVIQACREANVPYLVYTSSSEVLRGFHARHDVTEAEMNDVLPAAGKSNPSGELGLIFPTYSITKKLAEDAVLAANGKTLSNGKQLHTIALRPCGIYGEGDVTYVTGVLRTGKAIRVLPIMGGPEVKMSKVYAGNVAWAHIAALNAMRNTVQPAKTSGISSGGAICGKAYNITDGTSTENTFTWAKTFMETQRIKLVPLNIPLWLVYYFWVLLEAFVYLLSPLIRIQLPANRNELFLACTTSTYNGRLAKQTLGYSPIYSAKDAYQRSLSYYSKLKL